MVLTQETFDVIIEAVVPIIEEALQAFPIEDESGSSQTSIGQIDYSLTNVLLSNINLASAEVALQAEASSIAIRFHNSSIDGSFSYAYQLLAWPYLSEEGTGRLAVTGFEFSVSLRLSQDPDVGDLVFSVEALEVSMDDFALELEGGVLAGIVDAVEALFEDSITAFIGDLFTVTLYDVLVDYFGYVNTNVLCACERDICLDYRLGADVTILETYLYGQIGGTFYWGPRQDTYAPPAAWPELPSAVNSRMVQLIYGVNSFVTYFDALTAAGLLADTACDAADSTACGMTADGAALLAADAVADAFPEFAAAHPGSAAAVTVALVAAPAPDILYSAVKVLFEATFAVAPFDTAAGTAGAVAATFAADVDAAGDFDFREYHGAAADTVIPATEALTLTFDKYATALAVDSTELGAVAVTDALCSWVEDVFFEMCVWGAWADALYDTRFTAPRVATLDYTNRSVVYDPDYVALTFNVTPDEKYVLRSFE